MGYQMVKGDANTALKDTIYSCDIGKLCEDVLPQRRSDGKNLCATG